MYQLELSKSRHTNEENKNKKYQPAQAKEIDGWMRNRKLIEQGLGRLASQHIVKHTLQLKGYRSVSSEFGIGGTRNHRWECQFEQYLPREWI